MSDERYVLVYKPDSNLEFKYFESQNLYLGQAMLTKDLENAAKMSLDEAECTLNLMTTKSDWQIWSIKSSIVLDKQSFHHELINKKKQLLEEISSIDYKLQRER